MLSQNYSIQTIFQLFYFFTYFSDYAVTFSSPTLITFFTLSQNCNSSTFWHFVLITYPVTFLILLFNLFFITVFMQTQDFHLSLVFRKIGWLIQNRGLWTQNDKKVCWKQIWKYLKYPTIYLAYLPSLLNYLRCVFWKKLLLLVRSPCPRYLILKCSAGPGCRSWLRTTLT